MLPSKRGADDLSRFSTDSSISGFWSELSDEAASKLSKSVVSIALTHGDLVGQNVLFASCGIAIECQPNFTKFVTSAILVRALNTERNGHDNIKVMQGGALFEFDGNFVGMNLFSNMERPIFLPRDIIFDRLNHFQTSMEKIIFPMLLKSVRHRKRLTGVELHSYPEGSTSVNTFGEQFGDEYPTGVWGKFKKEVSSNISEIVVAVASFHGETKFFACTGFFINYDGCPTILTSASLVRDPDGANEIVSSLRIEVLLPNKDHTVGELEHYSLHYNVALVSVKNYNVDCPKLKCELMRYCGTVVAVGRCFESGILMATSGEFIHDCDEESIDSDCEYFSYTTCRTTKVVIGGPVVDLDGKFVGINYYDTKIGTPLLCFIDICEILDDLKTKKAMIGGHEGRLKNDDGPPNIWILPA
ncbi:hypothetical protein SORBI_3008G105300 [Sorghum bicolor]|uniref:Uncharacterized protein n=2 Tax=Sorghum bicolor TaxID=4558 RepID=A0A1B6PD05_SORBI|nr:hypothetical protein SORBI_3008G105300 [Sorghum bicolor]KXG23517.1 hypothetical protein SORBI_3008G105300 [Sorghum bicolor]